MNISNSMKWKIQIMAPSHSIEELEETLNPSKNNGSDYRVDLTSLDLNSVTLPSASLPTNTNSLESSNIL